MSVVLALQNLKSGGDSVTVGNLNKLNVYDEESINILTHILKELKIMNIHLSILTDNKVTNLDLEVI